MPKNELIDAIKDQNLPRIQAYLQANPEQDYNALTPNGLNALWLALTPAQGKTISLEVVTLLTGSLKTNGEALINPTQPYNGFTPSEYLQYIGSYLIKQGHIADHTALGNLEYQIQLTENHFVAEADLPQNMGGIAADAQNVHNSYVSKLAKSNLARLYQYYVVEQGKSLDTTARSTSVNTLEQAINALKRDPSRAQAAQQMEQNIAFCLKSSTSFALKLESEQEVNLTLGDVLALLGHAIADNASTPDLAQDADEKTKTEARDERIQGVLDILYENATAYGLNKVSCEGGAFNRFGFALAARHRLVQTSSNEPLTGEMAAIEMRLFFKKQLALLEQSNLPLYWQLVRAQLTDNPTEEIDEKAYQDFVRTSCESWLKVLENTHRVDAQEIKQFLGAMDGAYPYHFHEITRNMMVLLAPIVSKPEGQAFLTTLQGNYSPIVAQSKLLDLSATLLMQQASFQQLLSSSKIPLTRELVSLFISTFLAYSRQNGNQTRYFETLFNNKPLDDNAQAIARKILYLSLFEHQKEQLVRAHPELENWLKRLTQDERLDLMETFALEHPNCALDNVSASTPLLIKIALQKGYIRHLSLQGITFQNRDFRGFSFDGVDLQGATFINCDLRLVTSRNANFTNITFKGCVLPFFNQNTKYSDEQLGEALLNCAQAGEIFSMQGLLQTQGGLSAKVLEYQDKYGDNALMRAAGRGHTEVVKLLLADKNCTAQLFNQANAYGENALMKAARLGKTEAVKLLLADEHCTAQLFNQATTEGENVLMLAALYRQTEVVKLLLADKHCTAQLLNHVGMHDHNALMIAAAGGHTEVMKLLLAHKDCAIQKCRTVALNRLEKPYPILLQTYLAMAGYSDDSYSSKISSFFSNRPHRSFIKKLLAETEPLTPEKLYHKVHDYHASLKEDKKDYYIKRIVDLVDQFPSEFKFEVTEAKQNTLGG